MWPHTWALNLAQLNPALTQFSLFDKPLQNWLLLIELLNVLTGPVPLFSPGQRSGHTHKKTRAILNRWRACWVMTAWRSVCAHHSSAPFTPAALRAHHSLIQEPATFHWHYATNNPSARILHDITANYKRRKSLMTPDGSQRCMDQSSKIEWTESCYQFGYCWSCWLA